MHVRVLTSCKAPKRYVIKYTTTYLLLTVSYINFLLQYIVY